MKSWSPAGKGMNDRVFNSYLLPRRVYKTQTFKFTADTVGDQNTIHTEVR